MRKFFKATRSLALAALILLLGAAAFPYTMPETEAFAADYYAPITATSGTELLGQVHDLITETHTHYTSYGDCSTPSLVKQTDPGSSSSYVMEFYSQADIASTWGSGAVGTWNKEHVWCKSLSGGLWTSISNSGRGGGADMHHIRPVESRLNSTRSNNKYGTVSNRDSKKVYYKDANGGIVAHGGYNGSGVFEPLDNVKGDVARIVMYVYTHYNTFSNVGGTTNGSGSSGYFGTLNFTNIMAPTSESAAKELLLEWNESDPVDDIERTRNEAVYEIQGNRNPFIDHPEYADAIWGDGSLGDPVAPTSLSLTPSSVSMTVGKTQELTVSAQPSDATKSVTWKSDNAAVASVSNGTVTANGEGVAHITATSTVASSVTATATVTVTKPAAGETASLTITLESFDLVDNYNFQNWSSGGVEGIAYIFGGSATYPAENGMQFKTGAESCYLANTTAIPGKITSITAKSFKYANNWTVLTSDASFGRVTGKPTGGTNQGQKQVPTTGATWEIGGDDSFFAITYDTTEYSGYLDSITVEYIVSQDAPHQHVFEYEILDENSHTVTCESCGEVHETEPHEYSDASDTTCNKCGFERTVHNEEALEVFHAAVTAIQTEGTLSERFACIKRAIEAYRALTQDQLALAEEDIGLLEAAIEAYNESIQAYNADAAAANKGALGALLNG